MLRPHGGHDAALMVAPREGAQVYRAHALGHYIPPALMICAMKAGAAEAVVAGSLEPQHLQTAIRVCAVPASSRTLERGPSAPTTSLARMVCPLSRPTSASPLLCMPVRQAWGGLSRAGGKGCEYMSKPQQIFV